MPKPTFDPVSILYEVRSFCKKQPRFFSDTPNSVSILYEVRSFCKSSLRAGRGL